MCIAIMFEGLTPAPGILNGRNGTNTPSVTKKVNVLLNLKLIKNIKISKIFIKYLCTRN